MSTRHTLRPRIRVRLERTAAPEAWKRAAPGVRALLERHPWIARTPGREAARPRTPET